MLSRIQLGSGWVHYAEEGKGSPLILLHANPGDGKDFEAIIPVLAQQYRVIALDLPGYGESAPPPDPESVDVLFY